MSGKRYYITLLVGILMASRVAIAQEEALSAKKFSPLISLSPSLWREAENPALLHASGVMNYAITSLGGLNRFGGLKRPQEPIEQGIYTFNAEGASRVGEWIAAGSFTYRRVNDKSVEWLASESAYQGNPFLYADSIGGDWFRDVFALTAALGSPEWFERLSLGAKLDYDVGQGARRNGARPLYRTRRITFKTAVAFRLFGKERVSLSPVWNWRKEENEFAFFTTQSDWRLYFLQGFGTFFRTTVNSAERNITGDLKGIDTGYQGGAGDWTWSASANWLTGITNVIDGVAVASFSGRVIHNLEGYHIAAQRLSKQVSVEVRSAYSKRDERGADDFNASITSSQTEPDFLAINVIDQEETTRFEVELWLDEARATSPLRVFAKWQKQERVRRDILAETDWRTTLRSVQIGALSVVPVFEAMLFSGAMVGYTSPSNPTYRADQPTALTPILVRPDFLVMSAERRMLSLIFGVETTAIWIRASSLRAFLNLNYTDSPARFDNGEKIGLRRTIALELQLLY
jgi:hypothetical protein